MNKVWWCDSIPLTTCLDKICKYHAWVSVKDFSMGIVMLLQTFRQSCLSSKDYVHQQSRVGHLHQYIGKMPALFEGCKRALATVRAGGDPVWQSLVIKYNKSDSHFQNRRQFQSDVMFPWKLHAFSGHVDLEWSSDAWHFFVAEIACHAEEDWWGDTVAEHFFRRAFLSRNFLPKKKVFFFLGRNYPGGFQACGVCLRQGPAPRWLVTRVWSELRGHSSCLTSKDDPRGTLAPGNPSGWRKT